jgi:uncharacterized iron-regulated protein
VHWKIGQSQHALLGQVLKGEQPIVIDRNGCARSPLQQLTIELWNVIRDGGIVLLGEVHDNPEHHAVRGDILSPRLEPILTTTDLRPAAVFEHVRTSQQLQIDLFYRQAARSRRRLGAADLLRLLGWKESGWPTAETFYPLFNAVLWAKLPIYPGNAVRERLRTIIKDPSSADTDEKAALEAASRMPEPLLATLKEELAGSHCGKLPETAVGAMSMAQRYTDAHLAKVLVTTATKNGGGFLLAGNGHVRSDRGVPWFVRQWAPNRKLLSVMLIEVEPGVDEAARYVPRDREKTPAADYILFTPRHVRPDPCGKTLQSP